MSDKDGVSQAMNAVLVELGWRGRYQFFQLFQLFLCAFPLAFSILSLVFIGKANEHRCREIANSTSHAWPPDVTNITYGKCSVTWQNVTGETIEGPVACPNGLQFAEPVDRSMMSEWNLVCENEALTEMSQTLLLAGMMVGAVLFTSLADRFGRKPFHIGCHMGMLVVGLASAFVPTFSAFMPLRFLLGAFHQGTGLTCGILCMELLPTRHRFAQGAMGSFLWSFAMVVLAFVSFLMRHFSWRYLQLTFACSSLYCILQIWFTDESLRWLVANGRVKQAERILKKAAAINRARESHVLKVFRTRVLKQVTAETKHEPSGDLPLEQSKDGDETLGSPLVSGQKTDLPQYGVLDFFKHKYVFLCAVINGFVWLVNSMTYYGLSMTSVSLADDMYLGFFLSALAELPVVFVLCFLIERIGRKKCCDIFHIVAGVSLLVSVTLSSLAGDQAAVRIVVIALSLLGKFAISSTFSVLFLYTPEQFPTNLRNASLGVASMAGRVGGMIAPYSRTLGNHIPWGPGTVFGVCCLLLPLCMRMLPETCGRELPQTIEEMTPYITEPYEIAKKQKTLKEIKHPGVV